jgi:hypothetical protein
MLEYNIMNKSYKFVIWSSHAGYYEWGRIFLSEILGIRTTVNESTILRGSTF